MAQKKIDIDIKTILTAGILVGGYFVVIKPLLSFLGITKSQNEKKKEEEQKKVIDLTKDQIKIEEKKGNKLSYLPAQYLKSALIIQNATKYSGLDDDNETAITELLRYTPKDVDYYQLQTAFGSKEHYWFGVSKGARTLDQLLQEELSASEKNRINAAWVYRKMQSRLN